MTFNGSARLRLTDRRPCHGALTRAPALTLPLPSIDGDSHCSGHTRNDKDCANRAKVAISTELSLLRANLAVMPIPRALVRPVALLLVGLMVFANTAVAAYGCTGATASLAMDANPAMVDVDVGAGVKRVGHEAMDPVHLNLCAGHCQIDRQNADGKPTLNVPASMPVDLYPRVPAHLVAVHIPALMTEGDPQPMADPPHTILHCCFRL